MGARTKGEPDFAGVVATLVDSPTGGAAEDTHPPVSRRDIAGQAALPESWGGAPATSEPQGLLDLGALQAVHRLLGRSRPIGLRLSDATWSPARQFAEGRVCPDLLRILKLLARFTEDVVGADRVMGLARPDPEDPTVTAVLERPEFTPTAWIILAQLGSCASRPLLFGPVSGARPTPRDWDGPASRSAPRMDASPPASRDRAGFPDPRPPVHPPRGPSVVGTPRPPWPAPHGRVTW